MYDALIGTPNKDSAQKSVFFSETHEETMIINDTQNKMNTEEAQSTTNLVGLKRSLGERVTDHYGDDLIETLELI